MFNQGNQLPSQNVNFFFFVFPNYESGLPPAVQRCPINLCQNLSLSNVNKRLAYSKAAKS